MTVYFECVVRFNVNKTLLKETDKKKKKKYLPSPQEVF